MTGKENLLITLGGATGSGKTALALELAQKHPVLVILSADSRQMYKKLDVGSAKIGEPGFDDSLTDTPEPVFKAHGVSQFLIDIAEPGQDFTLVHYQREAYRLIRACWKKGKIPFLVGGTGLYLQAITEGYVPEGAPNTRVRDELTSLSHSELLARLKAAGGTIVATDVKNKRRLIRAIERAVTSSPIKKEPLTEQVVSYVLDVPWESQRALAPAMVQERLDLGLIAETQSLLASGIDKTWLESMGLSYRLVIQMLDNTFPESELKERMVHAFRQLMKRQRTWFNRMPYAQKGSRDELVNRIGDLLR